MTSTMGTLFVEAAELERSGRAAELRNLWRRLDPAGCRELEELWPAMAGRWPDSEAVKTEAVKKEALSRITARIGSAIPRL